MHAPDATRDASQRKSLSRWWRALSARSRERLVLGSAVAGALAARDLVMLGISALAFASLEVVDALATPVAPAAARPL